MSHSPEPALSRYTAPLGAVLAALICLFFSINPLLWDSLARLLPDRQPSPVVVVAIDDASLRDYGRLSSWPRGLYAQAIGTLEDAGAASIGLDILLDDPAQGDTELRSALRQRNVVLAASPGTPLPPPGAAGAQRGVSALNIGFDGVVRFYQTAYQQGSRQVPSFAAQVVRIAGKTVQMSTQPRMLRFPAPEAAPLVLSFRDVVNGQVRYADIQDRLVLIGLTAGGAPMVRDSARQNVSGIEMQARAVSSLMRPPFQTLPLWLTVLAGMVLTASVILLRGLWGYTAALLLLGLSILLFTQNVLFPGITLSLCAFLGWLLVALERWWKLRLLGSHDPVTGYSNRYAFRQALERRWRFGGGRRTGLIMVDLSGFRRVNEQYGRQAGDEVLRELGRRVSRYCRRSDQQFRWGADEFAILLDNVSPEEVQALADRLQQELSDLHYEAVQLRPNVGGAATGGEIQSAEDLLDAASRHRYQRKYQGSGTEN